MWSEVGMGWTTDNPDEIANFMQQSQQNLPPHIEVSKNKDGTYTIAGVEIDEDNNIYVINEKGEPTFGFQE